MSRSSSFVSKNFRLAIYMRDNYKCVYCQKTLQDNILLSLDHIIPESKNGTHDVKNLVTCCVNCNSSRGNKTVLNFAGRNAQRRIITCINKDITPYIVASKNLLKSLDYSAILESKKTGNI